MTNLIASRKAMQIYQDLEEVPNSLNQTFVTIGNFDGVHRGHQALIQALRRRASPHKGQTVAVTFDPHPICHFRGLDPSTFRLSSLRQRAALFEAQGLDALLVLKFDDQIAAMTPEVFVQRILVEGLRARHVLVGHDFRFGKGRRGTIQELVGFGQRFGFSAEALEAILAQEAPISSSRVRSCLRRGAVEEALGLQGHPYCVEGVVVAGEARGRLLGFPTANLDIQGYLIPAKGVYVSTLHVLGHGHTFQAITNIGTRPTFHPEGSPSVIETFILDPKAPRDLNLYDAKVELKFLKRLRKEEKFESSVELIAQIKIDVERALAHHRA